MHLENFNVADPEYCCYIMLAVLHLLPWRYKGGKSQLILSKCDLNHQHASHHKHPHSEAPEVCHAVFRQWLGLRQQPFHAPTLTYSMRLMCSMAHCMFCPRYLLHILFFTLWCKLGSTYGIWAYMFTYGIDNRRSEVLTRPLLCF